MNRLKHQLDFPGLSCESCRESYVEGELADDQGRMVYDGGCPPPLFQCGECPYRLYGYPDEPSAQAQQIWSWLCQSLVPDQPPPLEFFFRLVGVRVGTPESREIYERLLTMKRILDEHKKLTEGDGQPAAEVEQD